VWLLALRGHSSSSSGGGSASSAPAPSSPSNSSSAEPGAPYHAYTGPAPGVAGLTRAIEKAHAAVAQSEQNARQLQQKSTQGSSAPGHSGGEPVTGSSAPKTAASPSHAAASETGGVISGSSAPKTAASPSHAPASRTGGVVSGSSAPAASTSHASTSPSASSGSKAASGTQAKSGTGSGRSANAAPTMQAKVEEQLKAGKVVSILFWAPSSTVDRTVQTELQVVRRAMGGKLVVYNALAREVGSFGSFTRTAHVYATPTVLVVNKQGQTTTISGLTDSFSLRQQIGEAAR
jgi:hypothetical protein